MSKTDVLNSLCFTFSKHHICEKGTMEKFIRIFFILVQNTEVQATVLYCTEIEGDILKNI